MKLTRVLHSVRELLSAAAAESIRGNESWLASALRRRMYGTPCGIDTDVRILNPAHFKGGAHSWLYHGCYIVNWNGHFEIGRNSHLSAYCFVNAVHGEVVIGDDVAIGPGTCIIAYSNHYATGKLITGERVVGRVRIGNNVFIGAHCTLLPGTDIGDNVVVGANSLVKGPLEGNAIYAGSPCRKIRSGWFA